ncbi:MAG: outer membrane lipoprotein carrier protein LolA [Acidobacteriota bacterium]
MKRIALLLLIASLAAPVTAESPWSLLEELRGGLVEAGPLTARFVQTFVPAGFESGDREAGAFSMWLPSCLRWNYQEPESKHFLLCGEEVWSWNDLEPTGRHYIIDPETEPGLDLLLVDVDKLRLRYVAESAKQSDGTYLLHLRTPPEVAQSFAATIRIDPVGERVLSLEYTDAEGNRTRFDISDYQDLKHTALFQAPRDLEWADG